MYRPNTEADLRIAAEELEEIVRQFDKGFEFLYTMNHGKYIMFGEQSRRRVYNTKSKKIVGDYALLAGKKRDLRFDGRHQPARNPLFS